MEDLTKYRRPPLWLAQGLEAERIWNRGQRRKERNIALRNLGLCFLTASATFGFLFWLTNVLTHRICR